MNATLANVVLSHLGVPAGRRLKHRGLDAEVDSGQLRPEARAAHRAIYRSLSLEEQFQARRGL